MGMDIPVCSANVTCAAFEVDSSALAVGRQRRRGLRGQHCLHRPEWGELHEGPCQKGPEERQEGKEGGGGKAGGPDRHRRRSWRRGHCREAAHHGAESGYHQRCLWNWIRKLWKWRRLWKWMGIPEW